MRKLILAAVASTAFTLAGQHHPRKCKTCRNFMDLGREGGTHCKLEDFDNSEADPEGTCENWKDKP